MKKLVLLWALFFLFLGNGEFLNAADGDWRDDFDRICAHTADAEKLSKDELSKLIVESDELLRIVEVSNDPEKKIYLIRIKKCRNFFSFMRELAGSSGGK